MNKMQVTLGGKEFTARIGLAFYERLNLIEGLTPEQIFGLAAYKRLYHAIACNSELLGEKFMTLVEFIDLADSLDPQEFGEEVNKFELLFWKSALVHVPEGKEKNLLKKSLSDIEKKIKPQTKAAKTSTSI